MENLITFVLSVAASVIGNYISKWLDRHNSDNQPKKNPPRVAALGGFACVSIWKHLITFVVIYIIYHEFIFVKGEKKYSFILDDF